jgi:hypothetical protein
MGFCFISWVKEKYRDKILVLIGEIMKASEGVILFSVLNIVFGILLILEVK